EVPDTHKVPNSGPTVASRTCMIVGGLVRRAVLQMKKEIDAAGITLDSRGALERAARLLCGGEPQRRYIVEFEKPPEIKWDDKTYKGDAYGVYGYAALVADLEID